MPLKLVKPGYCCSGGVQMGQGVSLYLWMHHTTHAMQVAIVWLTYGKPLRIGQFTASLYFAASYLHGLERFLYHKKASNVV